MKRPNTYRMSSLSLNPFPNKLWFLRVCSTSLLKTLREKEKLLVTGNFSFSQSVFYMFQKLSKLNEFSDDNSEFDENGIKFFNGIEHTGKGRNCSMQATSPFSTVFSIDLHSRHVKTRACLVKC